MIAFLYDSDFARFFDFGGKLSRLFYPEYRLGRLLPKQFKRIVLPANRPT